MTSALPQVMKSAEEFAAMLARLRAKKAASNPPVSNLGLDKLVATLKSSSTTQVNLSSLLVGSSSEAIEDTLREITDDEPSTLTSASRQIGVAKDVILNEKQQLFNDTVLAGKSCCLIGAAGTGKTTSMKTVTQSLIAQDLLPKLRSSTKHLLIGYPGAAILSYTRKAVNNIRHAVVEGLKPHVLTMHKLLEFQPIFYEIEDPKNPGNWKKTMRFEPSKTRINPLPSDLVLMVYEESGMIGTELYNLMQEAMPHKHQEVFLGDLQQLPPVFGSAILGYKLLELPVIELTEIHRQAMNSPIIALAQALMAGDASVFDPTRTKVTEEHPTTGRILERWKVPSLEVFSKKTEEGEVKFQIWQKKLTPENAINVISVQFNAWHRDGSYNPAEDIILTPYNRLGTFGCEELNLKISNWLGKERNADVYEVIAGFKTYYLAIGDRVLYDKEDARIISIRRNGEYLGKEPQPHSVYLDRWGHTQRPANAAETTSVETFLDEDAIEDFILRAANSSSEDRVQAASHVIEIQYAYGDTLNERVEVLSNASQINNLIGGYALTVHKFQGSEADKVYLILHVSQAKMIRRELLYTAVTRAKKHLHIICDGDSFWKGIQSQAIKGNTVAEKAEQFKGKSYAGRGTAEEE